MIDALIDVAENRGYRIAWHKGGSKGLWIPHLATISLRIGLDDTEALCSLAHELGHAYYNDPPGCLAQHEDRADRFAAKLLISPVEYAAAEAVYGPHPARLAAELDVTRHIIETWQALYQHYPKAAI